MSRGPIAGRVNELGGRTPRASASLWFPPFWGSTPWTPGSQGRRCRAAGKGGTCRVRASADPATRHPGGHTAKVWSASVPEHSRRRGWAPECPTLTLASPAGDTGSDAPLTGRSSPLEVPPAAEKHSRAPPQAPSTPPPAPPIQAPSPPIAPLLPPTIPSPALAARPDREPGAGPAPEAGLERRGMPGAHARSAAARRVHSRRSFQRPRARRRPALLKLSSLPPSCHAPPHTLEQEETPL